MSIAQLINEKNKISSKLNVLAGHQQAYMQEKAELFSSISTASHYLSKKDLIAESLTLIHNKSQEAGVKLYEELLTKLLHEIMPANDQCERVILEQGMKRNRPTLNIKIKTSDGMIRDITEDKGGSIQCILAIGLRFIYVATNPGRNFIVFDEADVGLSELHMEDFSRMMNYLSRMTGIQVIYISHHPDKYFEGNGRIHHLKRVNGKIVSSIASDYDSSDSQKKDIINEYVVDYSELYIRNIRLVNCGQHENTNLELSPFVNYICGGNDIGKSTVVKIIKAMAFNKCHNSYIRDNTQELMVQFGLEDNITFEYKYKSKGSKKTLYTVYNNDGEIINRSDSGDKAPSFMSDYFSFNKYKNICPSISDQVSPIFIFDNDKFSEHERAEVLKLSDNASTAQKMIYRHNELINKFNAQKREAEKKMITVKGKLASLRIIESLEDHVQKLEELINSEKKRQFIADNIPGSIELIENTQNQAMMIKEVLANTSLSINDASLKDTSSNILAKDIEINSFSVNSIKEVINTNIKIVELKDTKSIKSCATVMGESIKFINAIESTLSNTSEIAIATRPTQELLEKTSQIGDLTVIVSNISAVVNSETPRLGNVKQLKTVSGIGKRIMEVRNEISLTRNELSQQEKSMVEANKIFESTLKHYAQCPLCKQRISHG